MTVTTDEIPALLFWMAVLGLSVYVTTKVIKQVGDKVGDVFS